MAKIRVSDYIFEYLEKIGVGHVFLMSGGGNIYLIDAAGKSKKVKYICNHHEQASTTAAEGYARLTGNIGVCIVTTGPGGTNAITGVAGSWLDSIPVLVISGQVKRELIGAGRGVRQLGLQEINIIDMVKPITKYAEIVMEPNDIRYHLEKAYYLAKHGRQGPVWLDIPLDVQGAFVEENELRKFDPKEIKPIQQTDKKVLKKLVSETLEKLRKSERPVLYAGNGIRLTSAEKEFLELVSLLKIPVLASYVGYDLIPSSHPYFFGRAHLLGQRAANFIVQNSDFLLSIGARLDILTIGFTYKAFARAAYKIVVDIDKNELEKFTITPDLKINFDAKEFILEMIRQLKLKPLNLEIDKWLEYGLKLNKKYPNVQPQFWKEKKYVNPYCLVETISKKYLKPNELVVVSNGVGPLNCSYQAFYVKPGQRIILNLGSSQMGYGLPAAIGVAFAASGKKRVICFEGDGSLQLNVHELQTVKHYNLPIKIFVYSNGGYLSIRNTQNTLFNGKYVASHPQSGLSCPDYFKVGKAYGIKTVRMKNHKDMEKKIKEVLEYPGPILCDINAVRDLMLTPRLMTQKKPDGTFVSPTLEKMYPFLSDEEFKQNMIIPLWEG